MDRGESDRNTPVIACVSQETLMHVIYFGHWNLLNKGLVAAVDLVRGSVRCPEWSFAKGRACVL